MLSIVLGCRLEAGQDPAFKACFTERVPARKAVTGQSLSLDGKIYLRLRILQYSFTHYACDRLVYGRDGLVKVRF